MFLYNLHKIKTIQTLAATDRSKKQSQSTKWVVWQTAK